MTISSIATTGPFAQTNNCGTSLAAGAKAGSGAGGLLPRMLGREAVLA
jgi:hypothetical protein